MLFFQPPVGITKDKRSRQALLDLFVAEHRYILALNCLRFKIPCMQFHIETCQHGWLQFS
jgi:hypothetical protein